MTYFAINSRRRLRGSFCLAAPMLLLAMLLCRATIAADATAPVGLYGRPIAQPCFSFPYWARFSHCRPWPLAWGYDPFPDYGPVDCQGLDVPTVSCIGDFVAHRPSRFYVVADLAPTTIDYADDLDIASFGPAGPTALSTSDLDLEFDAGGKYTVGARIFDCYRLETTFWGSYQWDDRATVLSDLDDLEVLLTDFGDIALPNLNGLGAVSIAGESRMNNVETNLRYWVDMPPGPFDVSLLVGARYLRIDDSFGLTTSGPGVDTALAVNALNEMYCAQIGIAGDCLLHPRAWVNIDIKGGICANDVTLENEFSAGGVVTPTGAAQERTSWIGDFSFCFNFQVTPWLAARIGYQALFVEGIATAAQNIQTGDGLLLDPAEINDRGRLAYHGPMLGLMGVW